MEVLNSTELFEKYSFLAPRMANRFLRFGKKGLEFDDLQQEALIALDKASKKFDPSYGYAFEPYAANLMYMAVMRYMLTNNPFYTSRMIVEVAATINKRRMKDLPVNEIAKKLNVPVHHVKYAMIHFNNQIPRSIFEPVKVGGNNAATDAIPLYELITENSDNDYAAEIDNKAFFSELKSRDRKILELRLQGYHQEEIAQIIGVSQVHISRIIRKLKGDYIQFSEIS